MNIQTIRQNATDHITCLGTYKPGLIDASQNLEWCMEQGRVFGAEATRREDNPYPPGTAAREWFDAGWTAEQEELCGDGNGDLQ